MLFFRMKTALFNHYQVAVLEGFCYYFFCMTLTDWCVNNIIFAYVVL